VRVALHTLRIAAIVALSAAIWILEHNDEYNDET
jgi:hypothetical protein